MTAPLRKIVYSTPPRRHPGKRGLVASSTFECGHGEWTQASERRKGCAYCFDCFYGKPVPEMGRVILNELNLKPTGE